MKTLISERLRDSLVERLKKIYPSSKQKEKEYKELLSGIYTDCKNAESDADFIDLVKSKYEALIYTSEKINEASNSYDIHHIKTDISTITWWIVIWGIVSILAIAGMLITQCGGL